MNERTARLRQASLDTTPSISFERASLLTDFYQQHQGKLPTPVLRARSFYSLCEHKSIYLGDEELIVGERGPELDGDAHRPAQALGRVGARGQHLFSSPQRHRVHRENFRYFWPGTRKTRNIVDDVFINTFITTFKTSV